MIDAIANVLISEIQSTLDAVRDEGFVRENPEATKIRQPVTATP